LKVINSFSKNLRGDTLLKMCPLAIMRERRYQMFLLTEEQERETFPLSFNLKFLLTLGLYVTKAFHSSLTFRR